MIALAGSPLHVEVGRPECRRGALQSMEGFVSEGLIFLLIHRVLPFDRLGKHGGGCSGIPRVLEQIGGAQARQVILP